MGELVPQPSEGIKLLADLEKAGAVTATALVLPPDTTYDQCEALATMLGQLNRTSAWLLGDLMNFTEKVYGETVGQVASATGLSPGTIYNYASVTARIPRSRRRAALPFSTHAEVAYLPPEEQERWLKEAVQKQWTKTELREARKEETQELLPPAVDQECTCPVCGVTHSTRM